MLSGADLMVSLYSTFANRFRLLLVVYPRPQVLQITGRFYHGALASLGGQGVTVQQGSFAPWELPQFIATTNPSATLSSSTRFPRVSGYTASCSADFATGRGGFLQLLNMPLSPCCPYYPAGVSCRVSQFATIHAAFAPKERARPPDLFFFEATCGFTCVAAR